MLLLPTVLCFVYGEMLGKRKESRPILLRTSSRCAQIDLIIALIPTSIRQGIRIQFGGFFSTFWTVVTTAVTTGFVTHQLHGIDPLVILACIHGHPRCGDVPGGKGVGMMYMVMYVLITVFIVGLMSGRTPDLWG